jgi:hypothetical protein
VWKYVDMSPMFLNARPQSEPSRCVANRLVMGRSLRHLPAMQVVR